ncbi:DUF924 family protein [Massilia sp. TWR1-2-2]|uniref:DUF924 family protein n=1 Tax=Massilia sp. TWR1-2-2 TaxID=2804584 RepID=UPI003CEDAE33
MSPQEVLDFWFLPPGAQSHGKPRVEWFRKDERFDAAIAERFGAVIDQAVAGGLREWDHEGAQGTLARILVLDQFTRNAYRGKSASFGGDALALAAATELVESGGHQSLTPLQRSFAYMPFEHAEDAGMQEKAVTLFAALAAANDQDFDSTLDYAHRHRGVIARFGRFPHRNAILGRASTPEELEYLSQPGSGF